MATADPPAILVVDDQPVRDAFVRMLQAAGLERSAPFRTVREAFFQMERHEAALVILDVSLALDDDYLDGCRAGLDLIRRWPKARVLFLTGWDRGAEAMAECPPGAPMLQKPFGAKELIERVKSVLISPPWRPRGEYLW